MPIQGGIPLTGNPVAPPPDAEHTLGKILAFQEAGFRHQKSIEDAADDAAYRQATSTYKHPDGTPDLDAAANALYKAGHPRVAAILIKQAQDARKSSAEQLKLDTENLQGTIKAVAGLAQGITDRASFYANAPLIASRHPQLAIMLGKDWDEIETPKRVQNIINMGVSADTNANIHLKAIDAYMKGDTERGIAGYLATTTNDEQRQRVLADAAKMLPLEGRDAVLAKFQVPWSEDNVKKWASMALTPEQRATEKYRSEQLELGRRRATVMETNAAKERAESVVSKRAEEQFPAQVREYVAKIIDRYSSRSDLKITAQQATENELRQSMAQLIKDHPKLDPSKVWKMVDDTFGGKATFAGQTPKRGSDVSEPAKAAEPAAKEPDLRAKAKAYLKFHNQLDSDANVDAVLKNPNHVEAIKAFKGGE